MKVITVSYIPSPNDDSCLIAATFDHTALISHQNSSSLTGSFFSSSAIDTLFYLTYVIHLL